VPRRSCVGCGRVADKSELVRLVARRAAPDGGAIAVLDERGTLPGRGAYLCRAPAGALPAHDCLARALRRGAVSRTLRARVTMDPKIVESVAR
jgi:predicted RNA-binding protein YlxR (DUF448 family)